MVHLNAKVSEELRNIIKESKYKYLIIKLEENYSNAVVDYVEYPAEEEQADHDIKFTEKYQHEMFDSFKKNLVKDDCRYGIMKMKWVMHDEESKLASKRAKDVFIVSSTMKSSVKARMMYATSCIAFKRNLNISCPSVQVSPETVEYKDVLAECKKFTK